jgi:amino acid adenylation domain-containing protein
MNTAIIEDTYPLSPMQEGILFQYRLDPKTGVYVQQTVGSLREDLDVPAFRKAWEQVLMRHTILRTSFRWEGLDEPVQDVYSRVALQFERQDWRELPLAFHQSKLEEFLRLDRQRSFDLAKPPLFRLALIRLADTQYTLLWTNHHIILDGRSRHVLLKEVFAFYDANRAGRVLQLDSPIAYRDHIDRLQQIDFSGSEAFWRDYLRGFTAPTQIDVGAKTFGSADAQDGRGEQSIRVTEPVILSLKTIAKEQGLTLNTFVQGAWALLLSRYTGEENVVFGAIRAGRRRTSEAVGLFINTLPVRVSISAGQSLVPWLKKLREEQIAMRDHEQTPLVQVMGWSDVPRGTSLFESDVVFEDYDLNERLREDGNDWQNREFHLIEESSFPLTLYGTANTDLTLKISYDRGRFGDLDIQRMLGHLITLLEGMAINPDTLLESLPILTQNEKHQTLVEWNDTRVDYPSEKCINEPFEAQAEQTPDAVALRFGEETLTYRELNRRANRLAHYLQDLGVGPDVLVGVFMERSIEMVVALYGIIKAGGAYVPLDPEYPSERVAFMLEDTQVPVVLTQGRLAGRLPSHQAKVLCLDSEWAAISQENADNLPQQATADNLAYVIYTSGSTGKPKGVMNSHRGISNRLFWMQDAFQLTAADRVLQKTPFSFDVSVWEFFWPMWVGAQLVVAEPGGHRDSAYLIKLIAEQNITTIHFVPSMLQIFLEDRDIAKCSSLRYVICSGEALPYDLQIRFFARSNAGLYNLYGPTEAAVDVTYWECKRESRLRVVPIGRPIANTRLYILDRSMQPVPVGVAGELYIGGVQVARGYLNCPELTAERFIPDPFSEDPSARLYKTGDLTRFLPAGEIEYLGRLDFQVKIHGFRIELGDIETTLNLHPDVHEAVVVAREDIPGNKNLVAYLVPEPNSHLSVELLRDFVKERLPEYMAPAAFVFLDALPLNSNGKVDRRSLPAPEMERPSAKVYVPPQKELEKTIAGIWRELLNVERVGIDDSFFDLGGHSLLIMRARNQLNEAIGRQLSITDMFKYPTIRTLTQYLDQDLTGLDQAPPRKSADQARARRETLIRQRQLRKKT